MLQNKISHIVWVGLLENSKAVITPQDYLNSASEYFKTPIETILARTRKTEIVYIRKIVAYTIRETFNRKKFSEQALAELLKQQRNVVMHYHSDINDKIELYRNIQQDYYNLKTLTEGSLATIDKFFTHSEK